MTDERLKQQLEFVLEIDKEKNIFRQTHLSGHGRNENDAEHAWHMAIMAYLLREYSNEEIDIARVMLGCTVCITDLDQVVAASGAGSRELKGQYISEELEHMIQERKQRTAKIGEKHYVQAVQGMGEFCLETICPIISGGDVTGAVLLLEKEEKKNPELDEKMAQGAADFLGRQMG